MHVTAEDNESLIGSIHRRFLSDGNRIEITNGLLASACNLLRAARALTKCVHLGDERDGEKERCEIKM